MSNDFGNLDNLNNKGIKLFLKNLDKSVEKTLYIYQEPPYEKKCLYCD